MPHVILLLAALQVSAPEQQAKHLPPSPIDRIEVTPANPTVEAQDSLLLRARALDARGNPVEGARLRFVPAGGRFEGLVQENGLVRSGATGTLPVTVVALVPGTAPVTRTLDVAMVPAPPARIEIDGAPERLVAGQRAHAAARSWSRHGDPRSDRFAWRSSAPNVVRVTDDGVMTALAPGRATITASAGAATETVTVEVIPNSIASMELRPATASALTGDVIRFGIDVRDEAGQPVRGLTPTWSFTPGHGMIEADGAFVGYEAGSYTIVANLGDRSATATVRLAPRDVRRPAEVVGRLPRTRFTTEEVWLHPNGRNLYLGTGRGGDVLYAVDVSDPSNPVVTDSLVANTRRVNDVMTTPDGRFLVHTREGAADRRNGIVIASLEDPAHPRVIAEFTQDVTAGVHSAFVYRQERFGTHVYLTNNGTATMHVVDINDPYHPREVGRWRAPSVFGGGSLHDIDVQDGLAYLSNWNEGLIILDVGNGVKGGSPSNPQLVSQYRYDLNDLYRQVEATGGPGFIRGTHTAWRHRDYVFIADEVFPASPVQGARDAAAGRAYGRLQVIDVSDLEEPRSVAWYEPEYGGVHNVWVAGDTLYLGAYNAGFRTFDISGELRGDLRAQQREMVHVNIADMDAHEAGRNTALTWGVVARDGLAYVNDINSGLWIVRMLPRTPPPMHP
ncbi:MAG TPA: Ig-like domain-containing protein [Longimicrobiales bacterium]|nr:Ig-like domain-containing protein [Longimicrobiales bacterium]